MRLKIAIIAGALNADARQAVRAARSMNVDGLVFEARASGLDLTALSGTGVREFLHLLSSEQRQLVALRMEVGTKGLAPEADIDRAIGMLDKAMKAAADLKCSLLCVDLGPLPGVAKENRRRPRVTKEQAGLIIVPTLEAAPAPEISSQPLPAEIDPNFVASVDAALVELGRRADRYGCMVAMRASLAPCAALERAIKAAACPWFGVDLDPVDVLRDEWSAGEFFDAMGPLVRHVRARDAIKGTGGRTQPVAVGAGSVNWEELAQLLDDAGYQGWVTLDPVELADKTNGIGQGLKKLRAL